MRNTWSCFVGPSRGQGHCCHSGSAACIQMSEVPRYKELIWSQQNIEHCTILLWYFPPSGKMISFTRGWFNAPDKKQIMKFKEFKGAAQRRIAKHSSVVYNEEDHRFLIYMSYIINAVHCSALQYSVFTLNRSGKNVIFKLFTLLELPYLPKL